MEVSLRLQFRASFGGGGCYGNLFRPGLFEIFTSTREVLHGVGADGVGVKFPSFAVNCSHFLVSLVL